MGTKRQKTLTTMILAALGALILGQAASALLHRAPETATARLYSENPVFVSGVVIRRETAVEAPVAGSWVPQIQSGRRVSRGQVLAAWESGSGDAARRVRLLRAGAESAAEPAPAQQELLREAIQTLNRASGGERKDASETLTGLRMGDGPALDTRLAEAEDALLRESRTVQEVLAPEAGLFVPETDGLEALLTPEDPWAEWQLPQSPPSAQTVGRLITGDTWYYRTALPFVPEPGQTLSLRLLGGIGLDVEMTVEEVRPRGTSCRALLSCSMALAEAAAPRLLTAKLLPEAGTGVEIPAEAVYTIDGATGVWCLVGDTARFKPVTIQKTLGDTVVAELDQSTTDSLWPGDQVLLDYQ